MNTREKDETTPEAIIQSVIAWIIIITVICVTIGVIVNHSRNNTPVPQEEQTVNDTPAATFGKIYNNAQTVVALGDSTMALADGVNANSKAPCHQEASTWVDMLGQKIANLACPGASVTDMIAQVETSGAIGGTTKRVFITVGTNGYRRKNSVADMTNKVQKLVDEVRNRAPKSEIIFVGYTPIRYDTHGECMSKSYEKQARNYDIYHQMGNYSMKQVAASNRLHFIPIDDIEYDICDKKNTIVWLPEQKGTAWHTTSYGHMLIAHRVFEHTGTVQNSRLSEDTIPHSAY